MNISLEPLEESIVIIQPLTRAQNDLRPHTDALPRQLHRLDIGLFPRTWLSAPTALDRNIVAERPQIVGLFVELAEGAAAAAWPEATGAALRALFPHADSRRRGAAARGVVLVALLLFEQGGVGEALAGYVGKGSKAGDTGADDGHVGF